MSQLPAPLDEPIRFEPVKQQSLSDAVLTDLRRAIVNGKLRPGEHLIETELANQFHVSRAVMRQAFQELSFAGLVEIRPRRGAVVTRMSSDVARDVCTVRGLLEGWAGRAACRSLTDPEKRRMRDICDEMAVCLEQGDIYGVATLDIEFHGMICRADPNQRLFSSWSSLNTLHGALISSRVGIHHYEPAAFAALHTSLCDVLEGGDPDQAERAIRLHYLGADWKDHADREG
ncbi:MAG: GntR family transcriptional regulator [Chloroflexota bacterium]